MSTRREFLQSAVLGATGLSLPSLGAEVEPSQLPAGTRRGIVDTHAHWIGPTVVELLKQRTRAPFYTTNATGELILVGHGGHPTGREHPQSETWFNLERRLRSMDEAGVERQFLSWVGASFEGQMSPDEAKPFWTAQNNDLGKAVRDYPGRFSGLASLPTSHPAAAAAELERVHTELGLAGATLPLDAFISLKAARSLAPIFEAAQKHRSHIFVHRGAASASLPGEIPEMGVSNAYFGLEPSPGANGRRNSVAGDNVIARDTLITSTHLASGVITLALTNFLDGYPDVTVQVAMMGGSISFVAEQIAFAEEAAKQADSTGRLRRLYYDTGQFGRGPRNLASSVKVFGADRILFGSDYGAQDSIVPYVKAVEKAEITAEEMDQIFSRNARLLFARA